MAIQKYGSEKRLLENQLYTIQFSLDGEVKEFSFTSRYSPLYSTIKIIRNDYPELFSELKDNTIHFLIWQTSLLAKQIATADMFTNGVPNFAVKQYVRLKTEYDIIRNLMIVNGMKAGMEDKSLGDFRITKEVKTPALDAILKSIKAELNKWESSLGAVLQNRGATRAVKTNPFPFATRVGF